jgi:hypothetical protein
MTSEFALSRGRATIQEADATEEQKKVTQDVRLETQFRLRDLQEYSSEVRPFFTSRRVQRKSLHLYQMIQKQLG